MKLGLLFYFVLAASTFVHSGDKRHQYVNDPAYSDLPFSSAVVAGDTLYVSGDSGVDPKTRKAPADLDDEIRVAMESIKRTVQRAGFSMEDIVQITVFCPDLSLYGRFNAIYRTYFEAGRYPARAFIGSGPLLFGAHFEVTAIAVRQPKAAKPVKGAGKKK